MDTQDDNGLSPQDILAKLRKRTLDKPSETPASEDVKPQVRSREQIEDDCQAYKHSIDMDFSKAAARYSHILRYIDEGGTDIRMVYEAAQHVIDLQRKMIDYMRADLSGDDDIRKVDAAFERVMMLQRDTIRALDADLEAEGFYLVANNSTKNTDISGLAADNRAAAENP